MSEILNTLRKQGIRLRRSPTGTIQMAGENLTDDIRATIKANKAEILGALIGEESAAIRRSEEQAEAIVRESQRKPKYALVTEETPEAVFVTVRRRDKSGWTISVPKDEYDPWSIASMLLSGSPEKYHK